MPHFQAPLNHKERKQTVIGTPTSVTALWEGETLVLEIKREARPDLLLHTRRRLQLAGEGKRIESRTVQYSPPPVAGRTDMFDRE